MLTFKHCMRCLHLHCLHCLRLHGRMGKDHMKANGRAMQDEMRSGCALIHSEGDGDVDGDVDGVGDADADGDAAVTRRIACEWHGVLEEKC